LELLKNHIGNVPLISISENDINDYRMQRNKQIEKGELSPMTLRNDLKVFHTFFNYYYKRGLIQESPFRHIEIKDVKSEQPFLTIDEIDKIVNHFGYEYKYLKHIYSIALLTGIRPGELRTLQWQNINYVRGEMRVKGKMGERIVPISKKLEVVLKKLPHGSTFLFSPRRKKSDAPYSEAYFSRMVKSGFRKHDLNEKYTLYSLRHTFATFLLRGGTRREIIKKLMGHSRRDVTDIYTHVSVTGEDVEKGLLYYKVINSVMWKTMA